MQVSPFAPTAAPAHAVQASPHALRPPARRARRAALLLSIVAVLFTVGFGVALREAFARAQAGDDYRLWLAGALGILLVALLIRMVAAVCELLWLDRTWMNLPAPLRNVGPVENASSGMVIGLSVVPVVAWIWKLGLVVSLSDGFERVRTQVPFRATIPKRLGMVAVIVGWVPGLNVYVAPFLWEIFATRIDAACAEILALSLVTSAGTSQGGPASIA